MAFKNNIKSSTYFRKLFAYNMSATGTKMNFISTRLQTQTANTNASKRSQQNAPDPSGSSHLTVHPGDGCIVAFRASDCNWVRRVAGIGWVLSAILFDGLFLALWRELLFVDFMDCIAFLYFYWFFMLLAETSVGIMDAGKWHWCFYNWL